jgi:uncharacterized membrane protein
MPQAPAPAEPPWLPAVRSPAPGAVGRWLVAGARDMAAAPTASIAYGAVFAAMGFALERFIDSAAGLLALITGFVLVGPFLAIGLYDLSRSRARARSRAFSRSLVAWRVNPGQIALYGVILALLLAAWIRVSVVLVALFIEQAPGGVSGLLAELLASASGVAFLLLYVAVGGFFAALVFATGALSVPMLLDRPCDVLAAMVTSVRGVRRAPATMMAWAATIALLVGAGMVARYLPLVLVVPLIGHASWHAYCEAVGELGETDPPAPG